MAGRKRSWLSRVLDRGPDDDEATEYELVVIDGADQGVRFRLDRPQVQLGRAAPGSSRDAGILLSDRSVSARQALLIREDGRWILQHLPSATNPTLVNGRKIKQKRVRPGDRIALGLAVLELKAIEKSPRVGSRRSRAVEADVSAELVVTEGPDDLVGMRFPLDRECTSIGRDASCDVVLDIGAVSRSHASLVWEDGQLVLVHESDVNPTDVNGRRIHDRRRVFHGDEIRISERVGFQVVLETRNAGTPVPEPAAPASRAARRAGASAAETHLTTPPRSRGSGRVHPEAPTAYEPVDPTPRAERRPEEPSRGAPDPEPEEERTVVSPPSERPTRYESVPEPDRPPAAAGAGATRIEQVPSRDSSDAAATRIQQIPPVGPPDAGATRVSEAPDAAGEADFSQGAVTRVAEPEERPGADFSKGAATRVFQVPELPHEPEAAAAAAATDATDADATRVAEPEERPATDFSKGAATRVFQAPDLPQQPEVDDAPDPDATRVAQPAAPDEADFSKGAATRIFQAPDLGGDASSADARTRIIEPPASGPGEQDATRIVDPPSPAREDEATRIVQAPASGGRDDGEKTMLRPSPFAKPSAKTPPAAAEPPRTRVIDLDEQLARPAPPRDEDATVVRRQPVSNDERTLIRPAPGREPAPERDSEKTVVRRVPRPEEIAATRIIEPKDDDEEDA